MIQEIDRLRVIVEKLSDKLFSMGVSRDQLEEWTSDEPDAQDDSSDQEQERDGTQEEGTLDGLMDQDGSPALPHRVLSMG